MSKNSKAYRAALEKLDRDSLYTPLQAAKLAKETSSTKQGSTVEVAIRLVSTRAKPTMISSRSNCVRRGHLWPRGSLKCGFTPPR